MILIRVIDYVSASLCFDFQGNKVTSKFPNKTNKVVSIRQPVLADCFNVLDLPK